MFRHIITIAILGALAVANATACETVTAQQLADALSKARVFKADFSPAPWRPWA
jgi:hypothetical protein